MKLMDLVTMTFGDWILETRLTKRMDAKECAERACVSPQAWSEWETGRSRRKDGKPPQPTRSTVQKIAVALDEPIEVALRAAGYAPQKAPSLSRRQDNSQLPSELETVFAFQGRVFDVLPPGPARDRYKAKLIAAAEADLAMFEARMAQDEAQ